MGLMSNGREVGFQVLSIATHVAAFTAVSLASYGPQKGNFGQDQFVQVEFEPLALNSAGGERQVVNPTVAPEPIMVPAKKLVKSQKKTLARPTQLPKKSTKEQKTSDLASSIVEEVSPTSVVVEPPADPQEKEVKEEIQTWAKEEDRSDELDVDQELAVLEASSIEDGELESPGIEDDPESEKSALAEESERQIEDEISKLNQSGDPNLAETSAQNSVGGSAVANHGGHGKTEGGLPQKLSLGYPGGIKDGALLLEKKSMKPRYNTRDRLARREGSVTFHYTVTGNGHVRDIVIVESSGHRSLDRESFKALKETVYFPGQGGRCKKTYRWSLKGGVQEMPSRLRQAKR